MRKINESKDNAKTKQEKLELENLARKGDTFALTELLILYRPRLEGMAYKFCQDRSIAEDMVSESYERAWKFFPKFRGDSTIFTWLYRITLNIGYNHSSTRKRKVLANGVDSRIYEYDESRLNQSHYRPAMDNPSDSAEAMQTRDSIEKAYDRLSGDHQEALTLYEEKGLAYKEIADIMGIPIGTVKSRLFGARELLADSLTDFERN